MVTRRRKPSSSTGRQRLLALREVDARPLTSIGIGRAGIAETTRGTRVASPARMTHKVFVTLGGRGYLSSEGKRWEMKSRSLLTCPVGMQCEYGALARRWKHLWLNLADTPHWGEVGRRGVAVQETVLASRLERAMEGILEELGEATPVLPETPGPRDAYENEGRYLEATRPDRYGWAYPPPPSGPAPSGPGELYARLIRRYVHDLLGVEDTVGPDRLGARLDRLWARVRGSLHEGWTGAQLAAAVHVSPATFHRMTRERYATTPGALLGQIRMEQARRLLVHSDDPIKAIASRLGYANPFAFSSAFKARTGMSPSAYRARQREA